MGKKVKSNALVPAGDNGGLVKWDEELAKLTTQAAEAVAGIGGGSFLSLRGGQLSYGGQVMPGNTCAAVILDFVNENIFYGARFDPDQRLSPKCYAFGRDPQRMTPYPDVEEPVHDSCRECPNNAWGTSDTGRGKACKNTMRLALIPAGTYRQATNDFDLFDKAEQYQGADLAFLKIPVTSVKAFGTYVKNLAGVMKTHPVGVVTRIKVVPDGKTQFRVEFEPIAKLPAAMIPVVLARHKEATAAIEFPYQAVAEQPAPAAAAKPKGRRKF